MNYKGQVARILHHLIHPYHPTDINSAVANKDADTRDVQRSCWFYILGWLRQFRRFGYYGLEKVPGCTYRRISFYH